MTQQRKLVAFILLAVLSIAAMTPIGAMLIWALCVPFLIVLAFIIVLSAGIATEDNDLSSEAVQSVLGWRAPPLG